MFRRRIWLAGTKPFTRYRVGLGSSLFLCFRKRRHSPGRSSCGDLHARKKNDGYISRQGSMIWMELIVWVASSGWGVMGYYGRSTCQRTAQQAARHCQRTHSDMSLIVPAWRRVEKERMVMTVEMNAPCSPRRAWDISDVRPR